MKTKIIKDTPNGKKPSHEKYSYSPAMPPMEQTIVLDNKEKIINLIPDKDTDAVAYIETTYPETAEEFKRIQKEQYELFCRKQMDYGPSNIAMGTSLDTEEEKRLSKIGLIVRINDKIQRLINLVVKNYSAVMLAFFNNFGINWSS